MSEGKSTVLTVAVVAEQNSASAGLLGTGQRLANEVGGQHVVLVAGATDSEFANYVSQFAGRVVTNDSADLGSSPSEGWLNFVAATSKAEDPAAILLANDTLSQEITPRLAHRLDGSSIGDAHAIKPSEGHLVVTRSVYGGKAVAEIELTSNPAVVWVRAQSMDPASVQEPSGSIEAISNGESSEIRTQLKDTHAEESEGEKLEDAQIIISGGRGLGGPEPFEDLAALAKVIKAQNGASRAACDLGWVPHSWQVGQTGKKVAPQLYLAVAISGASQHIMGMADSKNVAAINTDPDAPIFKHCQFGLVEDYKNVIRPLKDKLTEIL
ncbi:MAG: electron transfer flavoprotein [Opitutaceae bacterium]|nr:electron transfer flavoprotein [Opitutaceae bacterium]|tara:strand:+ start:1421 stop:2395 length:975 start_codon:yes stop_codon:yes gene_type:complete